MSAHSKLNLAAAGAALIKHASIAEAARALGVHERTLRQWLSKHPELEVARQRGRKHAIRSLDKPGD